MHFQVPLRSFEATVRLPDKTGQLIASPVTQCSTLACYSTPKSIPNSPLARKRVQLAFSNFSDDILFQARDRLRKERAQTLTGAHNLNIPRFNIRDCNEELYLTCGRHCVMKVRNEHCN